MGRFNTQQEVRTLSDGSKIIILRMQGYIQLDTVKDMEKTILACYDAGISCLALDFTDIRLINSTGLGILVKVQDKFQADNREIVLTGLNETIGGLLDTLGISGLFRHFPFPEDVIANLNGREITIMGENIPNSSQIPTTSQEPIFDSDVKVNDRQQIETIVMPSPVMSPEKNITDRVKRSQPSETIDEVHKPLQTKPAIDADKMHLDIEPLLAEARQTTIPKETPHFQETISVDFAKYSQTAEIESDDISTQKKSRFQTRKITTQRRLKSLQYKLTIDYYSKMLVNHNYPIDVTLYQEEKQTDLPVDEKISIIPIFPGSIITPAYRNISASEKCQIHFDVAPLIPGKMEGKIEFYGTGDKPQVVKFNICNQSLWYINIGLSVASLVLAMGIILNSYQLATPMCSWSVAAILRSCGGAFFPFFAISVGLFLTCGYFYRNTKPQRDSCGLNISL